MPDDLIINDQRAADDPSREHYDPITTWEHVQAIFGLQIFTALGWDAAQPGEYVWKIVGFNVRTGAAIFFPNVQDEDGSIYWHDPTNTGAYVFMTWAGAPDFEDPNPLRPDYNPILAQHVRAGFKSHHALGNWSKHETGDADFAIGPGDSWIGGSDGNGPGACWVSAVPPAVPKTEGAHYSDCCARMGWIGGTNHLIASPIFRLTRKESTTPTPTGAAWLGVFEDGELLYHVPLLPGMPPGNFDTFSGLGYIAPDGAWRWHVPGVKGQPD